MSHALRDKQKLLNRVRRIRGQVEAIERALEADASCTDVMQQITSCRGAINGLLGVVVEDHIKTHFGETADSVAASEHLLEVVHSYFK
jgi:DNA-binding FrmR family transcriptional regulator